MPIQTKKSLIILVCVLAVTLLAGVAYLIFTYFLNAPENVLVRTFVCPDESHYIVIQEEGSILVSGDRFTQVEESSRYSNGAFGIELASESFVLSRLESGEILAACIAGIPKSGPPPILN